DIDQMRMSATGIPDPHPDCSRENLAKDGLEMGFAYGLLFSIAEWHLQQGRSLVLSSTLSSKRHGQNRLATLMTRYPHARLKVIWCKTRDINEIRRRFETREFKAGAYVGGTNSLERWKVLTERFDHIELPHLAIDTSPPSTRESCVNAALS